MVGGGITGLGAAYALMKEGCAGVEVFEAGERWGGKVLTETTKRDGGFLLEGGPDSFIVRKPAAVELVRELGLEGELVPTNTERGQVYLVRHGRVLPLPAGMMLAFPTDLDALRESPLLSAEGKKRVAAEPEIPVGGYAKDGQDESLASFLRRRFGDEALAVLGDPLMAGIHAGDPENLSLLATFPLFAQLERDHGSVIRGLRRVHGGRAGKDGVTRLDGTPPQVAQRVTLRGGLGTLISTLVETLSQRLGPARLHLQSSVTALRRTSNGGYRLGFQGGRSEGGHGVREFESVIFALPAAAAGRLLAGMDEPLSKDLAQEVAALPAVSSATVSLAYAAEQIPRPLDGLGFVVPRLEGRRLRACTWSSTKFPGRAPEGQVLLRAFLGGAGAEDLVDLGDGSLTRLVRDELQDLLGVQGTPKLRRIHRWPQGIPQYQVGHLDHVASLEARLPPGLHLAGSAFHGAGIPDCIASATRAAQLSRTHLSTTTPLSSAV